jgi:2-polyprenyl-3-methyl-5-hydroxy-6-metoxy-1,4-benzoquinol methylase
VSDKVDCPLCANKKFAVLRRFGFDALARIWKQKVGFNPFPKTEDGAELKKLMCMECGLIYYSPQIIGDSSFYSRLSKFDWYYPRDKWDFDTAIDLIKEHKPDSVLEVGCGAGEFLSRIAGCVDDTMGLDINESALSIARSKGLNVSNQDTHRLDKSFDMIFLFQVLEHLESPREIISALVKKLNPGGCLVLAVPNPDGYFKFVDVVFLDMPPHHTTCWSKDTFQYLANSHHLEIINYECEPLNYRYLRAILIAQISQDHIWGVVKFVQKVMTVMMLPFIYMSRDLAKTDGQTHLVVMKKAKL